MAGSIDGRCKKDNGKFIYLASCNGAAKTTVSLTVLPSVLQCYEFVNADNIAKGLSPLNSEGVTLVKLR